MPTIGGYIDGRETGQHDFLNWFGGYGIALVEDAVQWRAALWCLASNLAVGAALCRSYAMGANPPPLGPHTYIAGGIIPAADWRPGHALTQAQGEK